MVRRLARIERIESNAKADRYIQKLLARYKVRLLDRGPFPGVDKAVLVRVGPAES